MIQIDDWQVCEDTCTIQRDGESIRLTPRVMDVLVYLSERPGDVVSAAELLDAFWPRASASDHAVHKVIASLRSALGDSPGQPRYIKTLPKRGYALIAPVTALSDGNRPVGDHRAADAPVPDRPEAGRRSWTTGLRATSLALLLVLSAGLLAFVLRSPAELPLQSLDLQDEPQRLAILATSGGNGGVHPPYQIDALLDSLSMSLQRMPELDVITADAGIETVAEAAEMGAAHALTSAVFDAGEIRRLSINLIRVADGVSLYANQFPLQDSSLLAIESEVLPTILDSLSIVLDETRFEEMLAWGTRNTRAYNDFLKAGFYADQYNHRDWLLALEHYDRAIEEDPQFINAYLGKATAANNMAVYSRNQRVDTLADEVLDLSRRLALVAPGNPALDTLNSIRIRIEGRNEHRQEQRYREQILSDNAPGYIYSRYALFLIGARLYEEAADFLELASQSSRHQISPNEAWNFRTQTLPPAELADIKIAQLQDRPTHIGILGTAISSLLFTGDFAKAEIYMQRQIELDLDGVRAHLSRVLFAVRSGGLYRDDLGLLRAVEGYQDLIRTETLEDPDFAFNNGVLFLMLGEMEKVQSYWQDLNRIERRKLFTRLHALEPLFPRQLLESQAYAVLLDELDAGRAWQDQLLEGIESMSVVTGVHASEAIMRQAREGRGLLLQPPELQACQSLDAAAPAPLGRCASKADSLSQLSPR